MKGEALFRDAPVSKAILTLAVPSAFSVLVTVLYNMTDMFFVGLLGNNAQIAAVSVVGPVFSLLSAVSTMIGVGGGALIARAMGSGDREQTRRCASLCGWVCILFGLLSAVVLVPCADILLRLLGATADMWLYAKHYLQILALGAPCMMLSMGYGMLLRAEGAIREGFLINLAGNAANLILDPLLILVLRQGVAGAAIATVLGNLAATLLFVRHAQKKSDILNFDPKLARQGVNMLGQVLFLGLPNGLSSILAGLASTFSNRLLGSYGTAALAAMGAANRVTMLTGLIQMGICMGVQPLLAFICGAGDLPRLKKALFQTAGITACFGALATVGCGLARHRLIGLFLQDREAAVMGEQIVVFLLLAGPLVGLYYLGCTFLQAAGSAGTATVLSILRQGALLVPCLHLMHALMGFEGIAAAYTVCDAVSAAVALALLFRQYKRLCI